MIVNLKIEKVKKTQLIDKNFKEEVKKAQNVINSKDSKYILRLYLID